MAETKYLDQTGLRRVLEGIDARFAKASSNRFCEKVLLYYGAPFSFNNIRDVDKCADAYSMYDICIFGDGHNETTHSSYDKTVAIFNTLRTKYPDTKIVGYVPIGVEDSNGNIGLSITEIKDDIDKWIAIGCHGIFLDEFGYDYKVTRERQNEIVDYCHSHGLFVFANSWSMEYCFSNEAMTLDWISGFSPNPNKLPSKLNKNDYYVYENIFYNAETTDNGVVTECAKPDRISNIIDYHTKARIDGKTYYEVYGTKLFALDGIPSTFTDTQKKQMRSTSVIAAAMLNIDAIAFGDEHWGSGGYYDDWDMPNSNLASKKFNKFVIETKIGTDGISFPYKWSTLLNGVKCELVCNYSKKSDIAYSDGKQYVTFGGDTVNDAWVSAYNLGELVETANKYFEKIDSALESIGKINYLEAEW